MAADPTPSAADPSVTTDSQFAAFVAAGMAEPAGPPGFALGDRLGAGGMGEVFRARDLALGRDVAVKLLRADFPPAGAAARRFREEARVTAQLQHPGIPPVYHVGELADGRPFLAMKLIKGQTLAELLKANPDRGRLVAAFEGVCQAVAYAHAHGVIHRDLKPGNVMVGAFGEVQVMDWGLAKVLGERRGSPPPAGDDPTDTAPATEVRADRHPADATRDGDILGTPAYMAPEQAAGAADRMDARTDVFGLGAVLCALLTGRPPYAGGDAVSTRLRAARADLADAFGRLDGCGADPGLVALGKRCLAAKPEDRPADAGAVAEAVAGLRRAADERARAAEVERERAVVREAEVRRRRRLAGALGGLVFAAVTAGGAVGWWQWRRAERALADVTEQQAETAAALDRESAALVGKSVALTAAEAAHGRTLAATRRLTDRVVEEGLARKSGLTAADRAFLQDVSGLWGEVAATRGDTPEARELRAEGAFQVAQVQHHLSPSADIEAAYRPAITEYQSLAAEFPARPDYRSNLARCRHNLGVTLATTRRTAEAERLLRQALADAERLEAEYPAKRDYREAAARTHAALGNLSLSRRQPAQAEPAFRAAAVRYAALSAERPDAPAYQEGLIVAQGSLATCQYLNDRPAEAEASYRAALAGQQRLLAADPTAPGRRKATADLHTNLGLLLGERPGRAGDAEAAHRAAVALREGLAAEFPARRDFRLQLAAAYSNLGLTFARTGRQADSLDWFSKTLAALAPTLAADPSQADARQMVRNAHGGRALALSELGRYDEALADRDRAMALTQAGPELNLQRKGRASDLARAGRAAEAMAEADQLAAVGGWSADDWYDLACTCGVAAGKRPDRRAEYATKSVALLRRAVVAGYADAAQLATDPDLDPLRDRLDFRWLIAGLRAKLRLPEVAPPPRPVN